MEIDLIRAEIVRIEANATIRNVKDCMEYNTSYLKCLSEKAKDDVELKLNRTLIALIETEANEIGHKDWLNELGYKNTKTYDDLVSSLEANAKIKNTVRQMLANFKAARYGGAVE